MPDQVPARLRPRQRLIGHPLKRRPANRQLRSSRISAGAIQASGSRPIRSRSARSAASFSSFLARRQVNALTPSGCAKCTSAPAASSVSAAQCQPYVASSTTFGQSPAFAISARSPAGLFSIRAVSSRLPSPGHPHQHRPPPVQVHAHDLPAVKQSSHRGLLAGRRRMCDNASIRQERRPCSFMASEASLGSGNWPQGHLSPICHQNPT